MTRLYIIARRSVTGAALTAALVHAQAHTGPREECTLGYLANGRPNPDEDGTDTDVITITQYRAEESMNWVIKGGKRSLPDTHGNTEPLQYWGKDGAGWTWAPSNAQEYQTPEAALTAATAAQHQGGVEIVASPVREHGHG